MMQVNSSRNRRNNRIDLGGLMAYSRNLPDHDLLRPDQVIRGVIQLGIDPFDHFERLGLRRDMPPLIYRWTNEGLHRQAAPWIEERSHLHVRDQSQWRWIREEATDAWHDDDGHSEYPLECQLEPIPPAFPRKRL